MLIENILFYFKYLEIYFEWVFYTDFSLSMHALLFNVWGQVDLFSL